MQKFFLTLYVFLPSLTYAVELSNFAGTYDITFPTPSTVEPSLWMTFNKDGTGTQELRIVHSPRETFYQHSTFSWKVVGEDFLELIYLSATTTIDGWELPPDEDEYPSIIYYDLRTIGDFSQFTVSLRYSGENDQAIAAPLTFEELLNPELNWEESSMTFEKR